MNIVKTLIIIVILSTTIVSVIRRTPTNLALEHDARSYYDTAVAMVQNKSIISSFFSSSPQFIDHGYPTFLAIIMQFVGTDNIVALQIANYFLWFVVSILIYKSLVLVGAKFARLGFVISLFSPLYLTFSGKVYSELLASLGTALLIYALTSMLKKPTLWSRFALLIGGVILFSTKSVLLPFIIPLGIYLYLKKKFSYLLYLTLVPLILLPSILGSLGGGRSLYTLNIQSSKTDQSYDQILACIPYYLSYPLGKSLLPQYEGACHQNDASIDMPLYDRNPYVLADKKRELGYTYSDWLSTVVNKPVKYLLVMLVSLSNIILFEGVYPSILLQLPYPLMLIGFILFKIILSLYLWLKVLLTVKSNWLLSAPLLYFALVVTNFPVEPRYFYPLIPYIYFLVGSSLGKGKK